MKSHSRLCWTITLLFTAYFAAPKSPACVAATDPCQFANHAVVPVNQITNLVPVSPPEVTLATKNDDKDVIAPIIFFVIILAAFAYIIYQLIKLLDKVIPPPDPPPQPWSPTNGPPITINPTTGPGPVIVDAGKMSLDTNMPSWGTQGYYHIGQFNYIDKWAKTPSPFLYFYSTGMTHSTNLVDWEDSHYRIDAYFSGTGTFFGYYHYGTNFYNSYFTEQTNAKAYFDLTDNPYRPMQFFRLDPK